MKVFRTSWSIENGWFLSTYYRATSNAQQSPDSWNRHVSKKPILYANSEEELVAQFADYFKNESEQVVIVFPNDAISRSGVLLFPQDNADIEVFRVFFQTSHEEMELGKCGEVTKWEEHSEWVLCRQWGDWPILIAYYEWEIMNEISNYFKKKNIKANVVIFNAHGYVKEIRLYFPQ